MKKRKTNYLVVKAKKEYNCDCCNKKIGINEKYLRINVRLKGIFHFCKNCKDDADFIEAKINDPNISYEEYEEWMTEALAFDSRSSNGY